MHASVAGWVTHRFVKWVVVVFWLAMLAPAGYFASQFTDVQENDQAAFLPPDAESTKVLEEQSRFTSPNVIPAVLLYERDGGLQEADRQAVADDIDALSERDDLRGDVFGPIESDDGEALQVIVPLDLGSDGFNTVGPVVDDLTELVEQDAPDGLEPYVTGPAGQANDFSEAFEGIDTTLLLAAAGVVVVVLLLVYRSPVLWLLPLISVIISLAVAQAAVYLLAKYADLTVNGQSAGILTVLVFGAGTDYALLLVARYREELHLHADRHEAMSKALHRTGPAIIASGATVIVGLLCLTFAQINSTSGLGPVAAIGIVIALVVMLTLLPALLVIFGRWVFWPRIPRVGETDPAEVGFWARTGHVIAKAPRATWVATTVVLLALSGGIVELDADGLTNEESFTTDQPSVVGARALADHYPGGSGSPVVVISPAETAREVLDTFADVQGIAPDTVQIMAPPEDGLVYMEGTLDAEPDTDAAIETVERVRDAVHPIGTVQPIVGGPTAINADVRELAGEDNRLIIPMILVAVFVILMVLLRAVTAPLILLLTVVLSFAAALGASALVFQYVFGFEGADPSFFLFAFVFLVALGIDYNIFLMTRVREETLRVGTRRGALVGLGATGGVITSAGLVLAGTFAALATLPLVFLAELGFVVALGVLLDTIIVRSVLVTALNLDFGRWMWWPSALWSTDGPSHLATREEPADPVVVPAHAPTHRT